ncbi:hypothetical protein I3842_03G107000 [Carya illinoinensis]|uniref:Uncharacterized protein n=1 Tax=Carya illinoinensis TaxID=32201 RepID=A0A922JXX1_CARIL|nr:hypothetical protein I3842_03G107000 [Carya illinoinensis]
MQIEWQAFEGPTHTCCSKDHSLGQHTWDPVTRTTHTMQDSKTRCSTQQHTCTRLLQHSHMHDRHSSFCEPRLDGKEKMWESNEWTERGRVMSGRVMSGKCHS